MNKEKPSERSEQIDRLASSLSKAQADIEDAERNSKNTFIGNNYADLTSVMSTVRGPLTDNGLAVTQTFLPMEGQTYLVTTLLHESGQYVRGFLPLLCVKDQHSLGSAITYARRFSVSALLGVCPEGEDDDGEAAMKESREASKKPKTKPKKRPAAKNRSESLATCKAVLDSVDGASDYLRGKGIDPGDPPANIREKIIDLGAKGLAQKIAEEKQAEEADEIIEAAEKVKAIKEDAA